MRQVVILTISFLTLPAFAFAAFNDATLTTSTVLSVGSYTLNISGSSAVVESMTVGSNSFSVTLGSGSSITVTSASRNQMTTDITSGVVNTCNGTTSSVAITGTGTYVVTPTATICSDATPDPEPAPSSGGTTSGSRARTTTPIIQVAPPPYLPTPSPASTTSFFFSRTLTVGQTGLDVKVLQQYLNSKGFTVALTGPGSKGNETLMFGALTRAALARFQKANNIYPPVGFFGPITKAFINAHP